MSEGGKESPRILIIDDNPSIHEDFRKILATSETDKQELEDLEAALFGAQAEPAAVQQRFELDSAFQGKEGLEKVLEAIAEDRPYAMAFVDVRMPPGWDGIQTLENIWKHCDNLQAVICTAHSDYSWQEVARRLGHAEDLLILKKPFETVEVLQMAHALTEKWHMTRQARLRMEDLDRMVRERTAELEASNRRLKQEMEERLQAQEAFRASEERFSKAFSCAPIPLAMVRCSDQKVVGANPAFASLIGRPTENALTLKDLDVKLASERNGNGSLDKLVQIRTRNQRCRIKPTSGQLRQALLSSEPILLDNDPCALLIIEDLTDLLRLEDQLRQAQKMESIGMLAAGVAHEFNNILTVIQGNITVLQIDEEERANADTAYEQILDATRRAATLTSQLLAFSRKSALQPRCLNLNEIVRTSGDMLRKLVGENYDVRVHCGDDVLSVRADQNSLIQVLINLVANARDATPSGGRICVHAQQVDVDAETASTFHEGRTGTFARLGVSDNGTGMEAEVLSKIFDPFFTTKAQGRGTGLGMSMVLGVVKQHEGWIHVDSRAGEGTEVAVYLPMATDAEERAEEDHLKVGSDELPHGEGETVLVVEDEPQVRELACKVLEKHGYKVISAENGREALDRWGTANGNRIDLLLTDMAMPGGICGEELARNLLAVRPDLKVICASGYSTQELTHEICDTLGACFLQKPYRFSDLLQLVRKCLVATN